MNAVKFIEKMTAYYGMAPLPEQQKFAQSSTTTACRIGRQ